MKESKRHRIAREKAIMETIKLKVETARAAKTTKAKGKGKLSKARGGKNQPRQNRTKLLVSVVNQQDSLHLK